MRLALLVVLGSCSAWAQTAPAFEVSSIKRNTSIASSSSISGGGATFRATNVTAKQLIVTAYRLQDFQVTGLPGWASSDRYDIQARAPEGEKPNVEQAHKMLQALLADRFQLRVRRETKDGPIYSLVVAKNGPKLGARLKLSADQTPPGAETGAGPASPVPTPDVRSATIGATNVAGSAASRGRMRIGLGALQASAVRLEFLVRPFMNELGRPVVDRTGLTGFYDVELTWTPQQLPSNLPADVPFQRPDPSGPSLFTALQEQLGLKLESTTGPVDLLVVEKVERPEEN